MEDTEHLAGESEQVERVLQNPKLKERFPKAQLRVVPHNGRPGVSVYGTANWPGSLQEQGEYCLTNYLQGLYDATT